MTLSPPLLPPPFIPSIFLLPLACEAIARRVSLSLHYCSPRLTSLCDECLSGLHGPTIFESGRPLSISAPLAFSFSLNFPAARVGRHVRRSIYFRPRLLIEHLILSLCRMFLPPTPPLSVLERLPHPTPPPTPHLIVPLRCSFLVHSLLSHCVRTRPPVFPY